MERHCDEEDDDDLGASFGDVDSTGKGAIPRPLHVLIISQNAGWHDPYDADAGLDATLDAGLDDALDDGHDVRGRNDVLVLDEASRTAVGTWDASLRVDDV